MRLPLHALASASLVAALLAPAGAHAGQHFNIIGKTQTMDQGRGEIRVEGGGQEVHQLQISVSNGPLTVTKVLIHFADGKVRTWAKPIRPRKDVNWTSDPIKWPSGKPHTVTKVDFWFTGTPSMTARLDLMGLQ